MNIYFKPYPPLDYPSGREDEEMEIPYGISVVAFLQFLDERGLLGGYGPQSAFFIVEKGSVREDYILLEGQVVRFLLQP